MAALPDIKHLFEPRGVAIIGASHDPSKIGYKILSNIVASGYRGALHPVNPKGGEILGLPVSRSVAEIPGDELDLACVVVPAKFVFEAVKGCADRGVKFCMAISSGFSDVGNREEERKIVAYARERGMRVLGPNIFGVYSRPAAMNATFGPSKIAPGKVAIVTQSGAIGLSMIGKTAVESIGLSAIVSVGNKADIDEADLLDYLVADEGTSVVLMYVEGVQKGERFVSALRSATRKKPVVIIKSGRSERGAIAAASHTGSVAGSDEVFDDVVRQCGVLRAESIGEAFEWCKFLSDTPMPKGERTLIVTNGGGIGVMAADACEKYGVRLFDDPKLLKELFSSVTPEFGSLKNPVDLTGQATSTHYDKALDAALACESVDSVLALYCETAVFDAENLEAMIQENCRRYREGGKPIAFSIIGGEMTEKALLSLRGKAVPVFADVYTAVSCFGSMYAYHRRRNERPEAVLEADIDVGAIEELCVRAHRERRSSFLADEGQRLLELMGIPMPKTGLARNLDEAVKVAESIGYPVVMKVVSRDIIHKTDMGGVALDIDNRDEVIDAYRGILHNCRTRMPNAVIQGVQISEMLKGNSEFIVGGRRDSAFGPVVMFGFGGIYVEVLKDVAFRAFPMTRKEVMEMLKDVRSYPLLLGVRGQEKKDIGAVVDTIVKVGTVIHRCPSISDMEINPVFVCEHGSGVKAVDVRIILSDVTRGGADA
ncbi:MAG: acetate--CoA ligase family protein [Candidatus Eisenbacteria bacterium]|nr:acetate--CoA ligase family protein [Candidatus Eisenbacteria bacterium]